MFPKCLVYTKNGDAIYKTGRIDLGRQVYFEKLKRYLVASGYTILNFRYEKSNPMASQYSDILFHAKRTG